MRKKVANIMDWVFEETRNLGLGQYTDFKSAKDYAAGLGVEVSVTEGLHSALIKAARRSLERAVEEIHPGVNFEGEYLDTMADVMALRLMIPDTCHNELKDACEKGKDIESEVIKMCRKINIKYKDMMRYHTYMVLLNALEYRD